MWLIVQIEALGSDGEAELSGRRNKYNKEATEMKI